MVGCLLLHGFTASPLEVEPLKQYLETCGLYVIAPTLAGHGEDHQQTLENVVWQEWVKSAEEALIDLVARCDTVYVLGHSMGGLIAAYLANRYPVQKLVLLSAAVFYINPKQMAKDLVEALPALLHGEASNQYKRYRARIKATPLRAVAQFRRLVRALKPEFAHIRIPTLIVHGGCDDIVDPKSAQYIYEQIPIAEKHIHILPQSKHIVCHDCERDELMAVVGQFLSA
ncbi:alpha/beta hydrolase [Numidum massiliense]|uniref:alpha/beta hydrolase n=1 Tax=Numidum massiliense TaxID=1522315 RepID=UPI0006D5434B|nr:alpha/beta fold hydrolase [Numidum massiliense]